MKKQELILKLYKIEAIRFGEFTLKSGDISPVYIDLRLIVSYPDILEAVAEAIWDTIQKNNFTPSLLCGVPYTALPIATIIANKHNLPMLMRRKEKKTYGGKKSIEGVFSTNDNCLIVEDLITTGSSLLETAKDLKDEQLIITDVAVVIDRQQGGHNNLVNKGYRVHTVLTLEEIFNTLCEKNKLATAEKRAFKKLMGK